MKRRNRANRGRSGLRAKPGLFANRNPRKRKSFSFEPLEARYAFSITPLEYETTSYSSDTAAGAAALLMRELQWAALQAASTTGSTALEALALPSDPLFPDPSNPSAPSQWHLWNLGQEVGNPDFQNLYGLAGEDINVVGAWNLGYTGEGILVAVIDTGVQMTHPDLIGNLVPGLSFNALDGTNNATPNLLLGDPHGTAVAGLIGATWSLENFATGNNGGDDDDDDGSGSSGSTSSIDGSGGGVGIAPEVTLVPILFLGPDQDPRDSPVVDAFRYALMHGVDITNNSWGPATERTISNFSNDPAENEAILRILRDSAIFGRDGLGMINVFASGNSGGPNHNTGFEDVGSYDSSAYNPYTNSRYVITVTGVDHDGGYNNADGTITTYPEAGPNVLVAAPTGSNAAQNIANDNGQGSGIWTTDFVGNFGYNAEPDPITGIDDDRDFLADPDYTARFNGTSAAAPIVSGVIALMLDANPNLTYRDVQEILVRSARQNAQFEIPANGAGDEATYSTWQMNQNGPFRDPDSWPATFDALHDPLADPSLDSFPYFPLAFPSPADGNDFGRQFGHYESQPGEFTNGAGYTVSQGYGVHGEQIGYGHGVVDAELAVIMARDWHSLNQEIAPSTEKTFTTHITPQGTGAISLPAGEKGSENSSFIVVPGGIGGLGGFIGFWNEYGADPPAPFDPAQADSWPDNTRGASYVDFRVPVNQQMNVEWVEVKVSITGPALDMNYVKINLTSPSGMQSELNHYYGDPGLATTPFSLQNLSEPATGWFFDTDVPLADSDDFVWTFATNRNWGESTNAAVIMDPLTGEPVLGPGDQPIMRDWELHIENWSNSNFGIGAVEIVWHGKAISGGQLDQNWLAYDENWEIPVAQRIQGVVGIDTNNDDEFSGVDPTVSNEFNNRYIQQRVESDFDASTIRTTEIQRRVLDDYQDNNFNGVFDEGDVRMQEPFGANMLVEAFRFTVDGGGNDIVEDQPIAQFLTGADGNYYFDLLPGNYYIRVTDRGDTPATAVDDPNTPAGYLQHYKDEWRITADWFVAPDRDVPVDTNSDGFDDIPGEVFYDAVAQAPVPYIMDVGQPPIPKNVTNLNFLLKPQTIAANQVEVSGTVWADVNADGNVDGFDAPAGNMRVYHDINRNGIFDSGEQFETTAADGTYTITILASQANTFTIGVDLEPGWQPSIVGGDQIDLFLQPGDVIANQDFFLDPPNNPSGTGPANITGFVFNDLDADGQQDPGEGGIAGVRVFIDDPVAPNGVWDATEKFAITAANGGYFFADVGAGTHRVDVQIDNEGTGAALYSMTTPAAGYRNVTVIAGATATNVRFGLDNRADHDWGDLPDTFNTTDGTGGPSHFVVPHFRLGSTIDGEVDGQPTVDALGDDNVDGVTGVDDLDDGVAVFSGGGLLHPGLNTLEVTVFGVGGLFSGWIDWNNNNTFDSGERLSFTNATSGQIYGEQADLTPGTHKLNITAPAVIPTAQLGARFRWGESGLGLGGDAFIGEVEDYYLSSSAVVVAPSLGGDFNDDGSVDAADFVMYQKLLGTQVSMPNSTNPNWAVPADHEMWQHGYGSSSTAVVTPPLDGDFNDDDSVDAADFVMYQKLLGTQVSMPNSTNPNWAVPADHEMWQNNYGSNYGSGGGGQSLAPEADEPVAPMSFGADSVARGATGGSTSADVSDVTVDTSVDVTATAPNVTFGSPMIVSQSYAAIRFEMGSSASFAVAADDVFKASADTSEAEPSDLLLLEEAWADLDDDGDEAAPITTRSSEEEDGYGDLELAAAFEDESTWWTM